MSVIIRLQNLPWTANALDIRRFFQGLAVPDGGVHIVGGDKGDAFIAFSTDEDARKAMMMDHTNLGNSTVKLLLSSKTEMQNIIAVARGAHPSGPGMRESFGRPDQQQNESSQQGMPSRGGIPNNSGGFRDMSMGPNMLPPTQGDRFVPGPGELRDIRQGGGHMFQSPGHRDGPGGRGLMDGPAPGISNRMGGSSDRSRGLDQIIGRPDLRMKLPGIASEDRVGVTVGGLDRPMEGSMNILNAPDPDQRMRSLMPMGRSDIGNDRRGHARGPDRGLGGSIGAPLVGLDQRVSARYAEMDRGMEPVGARNITQTGHPQGFTSREMPMRGDMLDSGRNREMIGGLAMRNEPVGGMDSRDNFRDGSGMNFNRDAPNNFQSIMNQDSMGMQMGMNRGDFPIGFNQETGFNRDNMQGSMPMGLGDMPGRNLSFNQDVPDLRDGFNRNGSMMGRQDDSSVSYNQMNIDGGGIMARGRSPFRDEFAGRMGSDMSREVRIDRPRDMYLEDSEQHSPVRNFREADRGRDRDMRSSGREMRRREDTFPDIFVYATNMPTTVTYREVRNFFRGCEIPRDGLKLINDRHGVRTGSVYVKFVREQGAFDAIKRSGSSMGDRVVRVVRALEEEYLKATDSFVPPGAAMHRRESSTMRTRSRSPLHRRTNIDPSDTKYVVIKNAPFNIEKYTVKKFLGNLRSAPDGIVIGHNPDGRPSGALFVEFESRKDCQAALKLSREKMMGRTVSIFPIDQQEFEERTKGEREKGSTKSNRSKERDGPMKLDSAISSSESEIKMADKQSSKRNNTSHRSTDSEKKFYCVKITGLPYSTTNATVRDFFKGLEISNRGVHIAYDRKGQALSCGFVEFVTSIDCKKAMEKNKQYIGKRYIEVQPITKKDMLLEFAELQNRYGNEGSNRSDGSLRSSLRGGPPVSNRFTECLVRLTNLSMEAEIGDVVNFFRAFRPIPDSVRFHFNNMGQRTGEGLVGFESQQDAQRAIRELNLKKLMGRPLCLHLD